MRVRRSDLQYRQYPLVPITIYFLLSTDAPTNVQTAVRFKLMWVLCPCGCLIAVRACSSSPGGKGGPWARLVSLLRA